MNDEMLTALKNFWELGDGGYNRYLGVICGVLSPVPLFKPRHY
jgi:hypothetical protein